MHSIILWFHNKQQNISRVLTCTSFMIIILVDLPLHGLSLRLSLQMMDMKYNRTPTHIV